MKLFIPRVSCPLGIVVGQPFFHGYLCLVYLSISNVQLWGLWFQFHKMCSRLLGCLWYISWPYKIGALRIVYGSVLPAFSVKGKKLRWTFMRPKRQDQRSSYGAHPRSLASSLQLLLSCFRLFLLQATFFFLSLLLSCYYSNGPWTCKEEQSN